MWIARHFKRRFGDGLFFNSHLFTFPRRDDAGVGFGSWKLTLKLPGTQSGKGRRYFEGLKPICKISAVLLQHMYMNQFFTHFSLMSILTRTLKHFFLSSSGSFSILKSIFYLQLPAFYDRTAEERNQFLILPCMLARCVRFRIGPPLSDERDKISTTFDLFVLKYSPLLNELIPFKYLYYLTCN